MTDIEAIADLKELVRGYRNQMAAYEELPTIDRYLRFIETHHNCLARSCLEGHVTGSAFIVNEAWDRVLLVHHRKLDKWLQPGGHCERGENALLAALREAREETGISAKVSLGGALFDLDIHLIPERGQEPAHFHYDARFLLIAAEEEPVLSDESHALAWLGIEEALKRNPEASMLRPLSRLIRMIPARTGATSP